jgi:RNA polymerase sigma-70 factor (ECF subfamily)
MTSATVAPGDPADSALIARWQTGDERAATILVERHASAVARYIASLGVREDVEDLVQDAFIRAFASLDGFRGESSLRTWLCTIARNLVRDRARSLKFERRQVEIEEEHAVTADDPLDSTVADETEQRVMNAVAKLSPMQRQVFTLRVADGMAYKEIAEVVGSTEGAARVHYHNAMRAIKEFLDE